MNARKKRRGMLWAGLVLSLVLSLAACGHDEKPDGTTEGTAPDTTVETAEGTTGGETEGTTQGDTETTKPETETDGETTDASGKGYIYPVVYPESQAGARSDVILKAEDFGVVGDGQTDDGPAMDKAVSAAIEQSATLRFQANKTYYIGSTSREDGAFKTPFLFGGAHHVTVDGQNSLFVTAPGLSYFDIYDSSDIRLENCRFTGRETVYLVGKVVKSEGKTITFEVDQNPYMDTYDFTAVGGFSIEHNNGIQKRAHRFMGTMTKVADKTVKVEYKEAPGYFKGDTVFLPNPGIGHRTPEIAHIRGCTGALVISNVQFHEAPSFVTAIKSNDAEIYINNMDYVPAPDNDRAIQMVAWRDGFHCKDNRLPIHWSNCDVGVLFDDVFNVRSTLGYVTEVHGTTGLTLTNCETHTLGYDVEYDCRIGDVLDVFNPETGRFYGTVTVRSVRHNGNGTSTIGFEFGQSLEGMEAGIVVANRSTAAPGSTIADSHFTGTYRFTRDMRIWNSSFDTLISWIMFEGGVEGPIAGNIDFINCVFRSGVIQIGALNRAANQPLPDITKEIKDIGFFGCEFKKTRFEVQDGATYLVTDTWTPSDLFTNKNRTEKKDAVVIHPTGADIPSGVTYDYDHYTMDMAFENGGLVNISAIADGDIYRALLRSRGFSHQAIELKQGLVKLMGLSSVHFPDLHKAGEKFILSFDYYATSKNQKCAVGYVNADGKKVAISQNFILDANKSMTAVVGYIPTGDTVEYFYIETDGTAYIGNLTLSKLSTKNPTTEQLENGHIFDWADGIEIGADSHMEKIENIKDEAVRKAIQNAGKGFTMGNVLHTTGNLGMYTGFCGDVYYVPGRTYKLEFDAYVKSPVTPGTVIYLISLDNTPGNRVLVQGLFTEAGMIHFETTWTVSENGDNALTFYVNNEPKAYPEIYFGDFKITLLTNKAPEGFVSRNDFKPVTEKEAGSKGGYTADFSKGNAFAFSDADRYTHTGLMSAGFVNQLKKAGFGDQLYYANKPCDLTGLNPLIKSGRKLRVTMHIYDNIGNLIGATGRTPLLILPMGKGVQVGGMEISYTCVPSANCASAGEITFEIDVPAGADTLRLYPLTACDFYMDWIRVEIVNP